MQVQAHRGASERWGGAALPFLAAALLAAAALTCQAEPQQPRPPTAAQVPTAERAVDSTPAATPTPTESLRRPALSTAALDNDAPFTTPIHPPPPADLIELARRFRPGQDSRLAAAPTFGSADVGHVEDFWIADLARLQVVQVTATLRLVTPNALWYTAEGVHTPESQLAALAASFETRVFPTVSHATLGFVPAPSADGLGAPTTMLLAPLSGAAGYFASGDYYTPGVFPYSNGRPMLYLDSWVLRGGTGAFDSLTGHELQHLLHHLVDPHEHTWVNEGISEVTASLVARSRSIAPPGFRDQVSLTNWPGFESGVGRYYEAAHLFFAYFSQRYGPEALARLVARPEGGAEGIDAYLREAGHPQTFERLFMDWSAANLLGGAAPLPYGYPDASLLSTHAPPHSLAPGESHRGEVAPFAAGYVRLDVPATGAQVYFTGDATASILDTDPFSGSACWWSNRGDSSHSRLTREFDLSAVTEATLSFRMWHNLEEKWDYLYVAASSDGGATWQALAGAHTVTDDPIGATYGPGITGHSGGWLEERVDLTPFTGAPVIVSFEQVFDASISLDGACIDDVAVPEIGFFDDAESDGVWSSDGFVRTNNALPQRFGVRLVIERSGSPPTVLDVALDDANAGSVSVPALAAGETATVIVASLTHHTRQHAQYAVRLSTAGA